MTSLISLPRAMRVQEMQMTRRNEVTYSRPPTKYLEKVKRRSCLLKVARAWAL